MHWNFPACFLVTLLIISLVLVSVTVIIIFLSEVVARGSSSLPFKVQTTSGTGIPWNHSIYIRTVSSSLNTSYLTDSYIVFTLKMESVSKNTIFGLKMMVKSGLEKFILKSLHGVRWLFLLLNLWFWTLLWSKEK